MSRSPLRRTGRSLLLASLAAGTVAVSCPLTSTTAAADPIGDARARAAALASTVQRLQTQAEVATERYDGLEARLAAAVTRSSLAQRAAAVQQAKATAAVDLVAARARALYEAGGSTAIYASVLRGANPADAVAELHVVSTVLDYDHQQSVAAEQRSAAAEQRAQASTATARQVTALQVAAAASATRVRTLLTQQRHALQAANADVRRLVAQQQAAAAAASAAHFQAALAAAAARAGQLATSHVPPPTAAAASALAAARTRLGDPYVWGATGPDSFDCSGLTQWSYAKAGIALPRVAADQWNAGPHVALGDLEPGDLLFWALDVHDPATIHHVAMYVGNGMMIAAPHTGDVVKVEPVYFDGYIGATRPTG